jgi:hypothetical protein
MSPRETPAPAPPAETEYGFSYGKGKLPLLVALLWIAFVAWFFWFVLKYQLPEFRAAFPPDRGGAPASAPK